MKALPPGEGDRVVYADRCAVDSDDLRVDGVTFRKIPRDLRDLLSRFKKEAVR